MGAFPRMERATDEAARRFKAHLERNLARARRYLKDRAQSGSLEELLAAREAAQVEDLLAALDLDDATQELRRSFVSVADVLAAELEDRGVDPNASRASIEALQAFVDESVERIYDGAGEQAIEALRRVVEAGAVSSVPLNDLVADLASALGTTVKLAVFEADTRLMAFDRLLIQEQAKAAGFDLYLYDGPRPDGIIRPFCAEHVGKVYTLAELDRLDNGANQPKPVSLYLGGFGCRHYQLPLTADEARRYGRR